MTQVRWRRLVAALGLTASFALAGSAPAWAQATGSVTGRVTDRSSGRPLEGAEVGVAGTNQRVSTDADGRFTIPRVAAGAHTIRALMIGYTRLEASINLVPGQAQTVDFGLAAAAMQLDEVVVTGQPGRTEKRTLGNSVSKIDASAVAEGGAVPNVRDLLTGPASVIFTAQIKADKADEDDDIVVVGPDEALKVVHAAGIAARL